MCVAEDDHLHAGSLGVQVDLFIYVKYIGEYGVGVRIRLVRTGRIHSHEVDDLRVRERSPKSSIVSVAKHGIGGRDLVQGIEDVGASHISGVQNEVTALKRLQRLRPELAVRV